MGLPSLDNLLVFELVSVSLKRQSFKTKLEVMFAFKARAILVPLVILFTTRIKLYLFLSLFFILYKLYFSAH